MNASSNGGARECPELGHDPASGDLACCKGRRDGGLTILRALQGCSTHLRIHAQCGGTVNTRDDTQTRCFDEPAARGLGTEPDPGHYWRRISGSIHPLGCSRSITYTVCSGNWKASQFQTIDGERPATSHPDRKSTRLNSSH